MVFDLTTACRRLQLTVAATSFKKYSLSFKKLFELFETAFAQIVKFFNLHFLRKHCLIISNKTFVINNMFKHFSLRFGLSWIFSNHRLKVIVVHVEGVNYKIF